jgi:short-subunit dehydrogenase
MDVARSADLRGRTALVTGASSGLGIETAHALAAARANLILAVRNVQAGEAVAAAIRKASGQTVEVEAVDLADFGTVAALGARVRSKRQVIDLLIANAGVSKPGDAFDPDPGIS